MDLTNFADRVAKLRHEFSRATSTLALNQFQQKAFLFVVERLQEIEAECRAGKLKPQNRRYPEITRIVIETDTTTLDPALGGKLIDVEEEYRST